jgi:uncharacterized protein
MWVLIGIAFALGLGSSLHCMGMCGPIAFMLPLNRTSGWTKLGGIVSYSFGRVLTYMLLGAIFGLIGQSFEVIGVLQVMSIVFGALIVLSVVFPRILSRLSSSNSWYLRFNNWIQSKLGLFLKQKSSAALVLIGGLNGLLPCGMVYVALAGSLAYGSIGDGMVFMFFFGLGTVPAMAAAAYFSTSISAAMRQKFQRAVPYVMVVFGLLILIRGLNLNIPYLSPEVKVNNQKEVTMSCCSKSKDCKSVNNSN